MKDTDEKKKRRKRKVRAKKVTVASEPVVETTKAPDESLESLTNELKTEALALADTIRQKAALQQVHTTDRIALIPDKPPSAKATHKHTDTRMFLLILASCLAVFGLGLMIYGYAVLRAWWLAEIGVVPLLLGGFILFRQLIEPKTELLPITFAPDGTIKMIDTPGRAKVANSLNLYRDKVVFEYVEAPVGFPWRCRNLSKEFCVHKYNYETNKLERFALPDTQYYAPGEFANVLDLPAHRRLFEPLPNLMEYIAPGIMALVVVILAFINWLASQPPGA